MRTPSAMTTGLLLACLAAIIYVSPSPVELSRHIMTAVFPSTWRSSVLDSPVMSSHQHVDASEKLIYHVGDIQYFSPALFTAANVPISNFYGDSKEYIPITVVRIPTTHGTVSPETVVETIDRYLEDDVLLRAWLRTVFLVPETAIAGPIAIPQDMLTKLSGFAVERILLHPLMQSASLGQPVNVAMQVEAVDASIRGPFLASTSHIGNSLQLLPVYRLYPDLYRTFLFGVYPTGNGSYRQFRALDTRGYNLIPVPSRLYATCKHNGVCGHRIGVKDIYDLKGVPTSAGSRAYGELYGTVNDTAVSLRRLEDLGAVFVGKTKTSALAIGATGNTDTIDEQFPFSPRADLYQSCSGSSSGSACAIAAYDWLDIAVGSDTSGSIRGPAAVIGLYGNRPSTGAISLQGIIPLQQRADTAGILARSPVIFVEFLKAWYAESPLNLTNYPRTPTQIVISPAHLQQLTPEARVVVADFMLRMQDKLQLRIKYIDLDDPVGAGSDATTSIIEDNRLNNAWWTWVMIGKRFTEDYGSRNEDRWPPVDPGTRRIWASGRDKGNWQEYLRTEQNLDAFADILNQAVLPADEMTCSESILVYDIGSGGLPFYRDAAYDLNGPLAFRNVTFPVSRLCPIAGCVDYTIPIGQAPFNSTVSMREELKAVTLSFVARKGCDFVLAEFVTKLFEAGLISTVKTGRTAF